MVRSLRTIGAAAVVAGALSGIPSTVHALVTHRPPGAATRAAGTVLGAATVPRGVLAHVGITVWWSTVLAVLLPARWTVAWGALGGGAIGVLDLSIAKRRFPAIAALPRSAQLADHVAFGALAAAVLRRGITARAR